MGRDRTRRYRVWTDESIGQRYRTVYRAALREFSSSDESLDARRSAEPDESSPHNASGEGWPGLVRHSQVAVGCVQRG